MYKMKEIKREIRKIIPVVVVACQLALSFSLRTDILTLRRIFTSVSIHHTSSAPLCSRTCSKRHHDDSDHSDSGKRWIMYSAGMTCVRRNQCPPSSASSHHQQEQNNDDAMGWCDDFICLYDTQRIFVWW